MSKFLKFPGAAPPRAAAAVAAVAVALAVHGAMLGLFHRASAEQLLLASPRLERQLAECRSAGDRGGQQRCRLAVVARARDERAATVIAAR